LAGTTFSQLLVDFKRPEAYPDQPASVVLIQTHISAVFLTPDHAWKIKKPVRFNFLDYSTAARRAFFCRREFAINRRFSPQLYLRVKPLIMPSACAGWMPREKSWSRAAF
jgi:hypothetical protein